MNETNYDNFALIEKLDLKINKYLYLIFFVSVINCTYTLLLPRFYMYQISKQENALSDLQIIEHQFRSLKELYDKVYSSRNQGFDRERIFLKNTVIDGLITIYKERNDSLKLQAAMSLDSAFGIFSDIDGRDFMNSHNNTFLNDSFVIDNYRPVRLENLCKFEKAIMILKKLTSNAYNVEFSSDFKESLYYDLLNNDAQNRLKLTITETLQCYNNNLILYTDNYLEGLKYSRDGGLMTFKKINKEFYPSINVSDIDDIKKLKEGIVDKLKIIKDEINTPVLSIPIFELRIPMFISDVTASVVVILSFFILWVASKKSIKLMNDKNSNELLRRAYNGNMSLICLFSSIKNIFISCFLFESFLLFVVSCIIAPFAFSIYDGIQNPVLPCYLLEITKLILSICIFVGYIKLRSILKTYFKIIKLEFAND